MSVSGTVSQTVFNTRKVVDHAFRRCRMPPQGVGAEQLQVAQENLYLILSDLANRGLQLWCIEKYILPLYENMAQVPVPVGTVDVLNTNLRTLQFLSGTSTTTSTSYKLTVSSTTTVTTVGILWSAASQPFVIEYSQDNATWITLETVANPSLVAGEWVWTDIDGSISAPFWRVSVTAGTLSATSVLFGNTPNEIVMARLNRDSYSNLPNKTFQGRPLQFWLDRQLNQPFMYVWPVPNGDYTLSQVVMYAKRYIMDVGTLTQEIEVPQRWYNAIVYLLAAALAEELPTVDPTLIQVLDQKSLRALNQAEMEERDNSPIYFTPNISVYTR
jgi:hypothetical protein